jgi:hypothetical protein
MCINVARYLLLTLVFALTVSHAQDANSEIHTSPVGAEDARQDNSIFGSAATVNSSALLSSARLFGIPSYLQATSDSPDNVAVQWNLVRLIRQTVHHCPLCR